MDMQEIKLLIYKGETVEVECKKAESKVPRSVYESYCAFANTNGGYIVLGVEENKSKANPDERFKIQGLRNAEKQKEDFWNTINGNKVNVNLLKDEDLSKWVVFVKSISDNPGVVVLSEHALAIGKKDRVLKR